jgi:hypothetical protein
VSERKSKNVYKKFCEDNRIRYVLDDCGNPISPSRIRKFSGDHLWWTGTDDGRIGVTVERPTAATYKGIKKKLIEAGCALQQEGDSEGNFFVMEQHALKVAELIRATKKKGSSSRSKRMKEYWANKEG